jgi:hypothetical protein
MRGGSLCEVRDSGERVLWTRSEYQFLQLNSSSLFVAIICIQRLVLPRVYENTGSYLRESPSQGDTVGVLSLPDDDINRTEHQ